MRLGDITSITFIPRCMADVIEWGTCWEEAAYKVKVDFETAYLALCVEHTAEMRRAWPDDILEVATLRPTTIDVTDSSG